MKMIFELEDIDIRILNYLCEGLKPKDIAHKIWKKPVYVRNKLFSLRKFFKVYNNDQLRDIFSKISESSKVSDRDTL